MTKEECEYCKNELDCIKEEHTIDCIFCECQSEYETNITCSCCKHDLVYCTCTEEEKQKHIDALFAKLDEVHNRWNALLRSGTE